LTSNRKKREPVEPQVAAYVLSRKGEILSDGPWKSNSRIKLRCSEGHTWETRCSSLIHGKSWCPDCGWRSKAETQLRKYVEEKKGIILSQGPWLSKDRVDVRCSCGFEWNVQVGALYSLRTWCPKCAGNLERNLEELKEIVETRGGKLHSSTYHGVDATYEFECSLGHKFSNMFKKIEKGQWCPTCNRGTKSEEIARETFQQIFGTSFPKVRPKWLKNSRGYQMEIDGCSMSLKIGFEYQGIQHFKNSHFGTDLVKRIEDDKLKAKLCEENGILLIILTYRNDYQDFPLLIKSQLAIYGFDTKQYNFEKPIDLDKAYIRDDRLIEFKSIMAEKDIEVLSTKWLTVKAKYELLCRVCGHTWKAQGSAFFNSRATAGCDKCARARAGERMKLGMSALGEYAAKHGGVVLSSEYAKRKHVYEWRCKNGHTFQGNFNNMLERNQFCPICENRTQRK